MLRKFPGDYQKRLKKLSKRYNRSSIAVDRLERYAARLYSLINKREFDLVVMAGNSGLVMGEIAKMVYEYAERPFPPHIAIPVYRDNTVHDDRYEINKATEVLFVDDEIATGTSAKFCIEAILRSLTNVSHVNFTIVAENMFFEWHYRIPGVSVYFYSYGKTIHGLTNNISHVLNDRDFNTLRKYIPIHGEKKQVLAMLLSGKVKVKDNDGNWCFDETIEGKVVARTKNYAGIKRSVVSDISIYIKSGIDKYKDEKIKFVGE
jgi:adenine/guanine phosphoribosyltransferase-like PRPP-binding protein